MRDAIKALVQPALTLAHEHQRYDQALTLLDGLLAGELGRDVRCGVLVQRSLLLAHQGRSEEELRDLEDAHELSAPNTLSRYDVEIALALNAIGHGDSLGYADWMKRAENTLRGAPHE